MLHPPQVVSQALLSKVHCILTIKLKNNVHLGFGLASARDPHDQLLMMHV